MGIPKNKIKIASSICRGMAFYIICGQYHRYIRKYEWNEEKKKHYATDRIKSNGDINNEVIRLRMEELERSQKAKHKKGRKK